MKKISILFTMLLFLTMTTGFIESMAADSTNVEVVANIQTADTVSNAVQTGIPLPSAPTDENSIIYWIIFAVLVVYEIILRLVPTSADWTLLGVVMKFLNLIIPNFKKDGNNRNKKFTIT